MPITQGFPVAVVSDELCDTDDQPPHQAGSRVIKESGLDPGLVDPPGAREQG